MNNSQVINKTVFQSFSSYLRAINVSSRSRSNYASDIKHFSTYSPALENITKDHVLNYVLTLKNNAVSETVINRRLSSLRHFARFQNKNYMDGVRNFRTVLKQNTIDGFSNKLLSDNLGPKTIVNYRSDARGFLEWLKKEGTDISTVSDWQIKKYLLEIKADLSEATLKRKLSSIRRLLEWYWEANLVQPKINHSNDTVIAEHHRQTSLPGIVVLTVAVLMIIQVFTKEKIESPWPDVDAGNNDSEVRIGEMSLIGQNGGFDEAAMNVMVDGIQTQKTDDNEAALILSASQMAAATEERIIELESQLNDDAYGYSKIEGSRDSVLVHDSTVTPYSYIYITPTSSTDNQVLYIGEQGPGYFVVRIDRALDNEVGFNWWLLNR